MLVRCFFLLVNSEKEVVEQYLNPMRFVILSWLELCRCCTFLSNKVCYDLFDISMYKIFLAFNKAVTIKDYTVDRKYELLTVLFHKSA